MKYYRHTGNIKIALFIIGIALVIGLLTYTKTLITDLRSDNRAIVRVYAEIIANAIKDENDKNLDFIFDNIIKKVQFPIIQTNLDHIPQMWKNLPESVDDSISRHKFLLAMDVINNPIPLLYKVDGSDEIIFGYLHYGDSVLITKLQWWTYIELFSIGLFIFLGFIGFSFIRNNEKRHIWVGMARETAHQLGTPVSALMGWVDLIEDSPDKVEEMIPEIKLDLKRLEQINRRFSNMGSTSELVNTDLSKNLERVINYLNRRMPSLGKKVTLINDIESGIFFPANSSLLAWSIENIVINSIDSIDNDMGVVDISLKKIDDRIIIRIKDNGRGIPRKDWRNIFRPGFSTKTTGWGLGLSLSSRIIHDIHKGKIKVVESAQNKGTLIEIIL
tara:strand:+ start:313 stop:1476 length:1164 start_codon:yes stop_codon:yes gene_type:complete